MFTAECSDTISRAIGNLGGQIVPKKCQESQQPTSPLNSIRIRLEFFTGPGYLQNKTIIIEFWLNVGGQIVPPKNAKNAVAYFSTELSTWVK